MLRAPVAASPCRAAAAQPTALLVRLGGAVGSGATWAVHNKGQRPTARLLAPPRMHVTAPEPSEMPCLAGSRRRHPHAR